MGNLVEDSERMIKQLQDLMRATVEHNKALDARKYEVNIPALRALGMVDQQIAHARHYIGAIPMVGTFTL